MQPFLYVSTRSARASCCKISLLLTFLVTPLHSRGRPLTTVCAILSGTASVGLRTEYVVGDVRKFGFSVCGCILTSTLQIDIRARVKL